MNIYMRLPEELKRKVKYFTLEHPTARMIQDEIERLLCNRVYKFKVDGQKSCQINGIDFFASEYFLQFKGSDSESISSALLGMLFEYSDTSSDEDIY
jgi:hypothetical protein